MDLKRIKKIMAGTVAGALLISATACTPISTKAQWSYKDGDNEKAIGVYIYAMYNAYNQAKTFAEEADGYKEDESFLDLKIKDDDGKEAVASDWIKERADLTMKQVLFLDKEMDKFGATFDEASYEEQAEQDWQLGYMYSYYSQYGYGTTPEQEILEPYGISKESYMQLQYLTPAKQQKLFDLTYDKDGTEEVSDKELQKYFDDNYTYYTYFTIALSEQTTDDAGQQTTKAYSDKKQKELTKQAETYAENLNKGSDIDKECKAYLDSIKSDAKVDDTVQENCEVLDKDNLSASSVGEDVAKKLVDMKAGEAQSLTVGTGDSKTLYVVQKLNTKDAEKEYLTKDDSTRKGVLQNMKSEDFSDLLDKNAKAFKCEINTSVVDRYEPDMFWEEPEETSSSNSDSQ